VAAAVRFMSLVAAVQQGCALAPAAVPAELLGCRVLRADGGGEEGVLEQHLGVPRLRLSAFLRDHVAPAAGALDGAALAEAVAGALRGLRQLAGADPDLAGVLRWGAGLRLGRVSGMPTRSHEESMAPAGCSEQPLSLIGSPDGAGCTTLWLRWARVVVNA
jgi:hypothetical protein